VTKGERNGYSVLGDLLPALEAADWTAAALEDLLKGFCEKNALGMGKVAQPLRVAVTGTTVSPAIGETLALLGRDKTLARIQRCLAQR